MMGIFAWQSLVCVGASFAVGAGVMLPTFGDGLLASFAVAGDICVCCAFWKFGGHAIM